jgi:hypothetical protein
VETLEALQLLVKTELFVVVVALDMRFVTLSLENKYKGILEAGRHPSGLDYLEKIIQLPYRLPPIEKQKKLGGYLKAQMGKLSEESDQPADSTPLVPGPANSIPLLPGPPEGQVDPPVQDMGPAELPVMGPDELPVTKIQRHNELRLLTRLTFSRKEHEMLKEACSAVGVTPCAIKRVVNVFKIMKIIWDGRRPEPSPERKRACLWLLVMSASPIKEVRLGISEFFEMPEKPLQMRMDSKRYTWKSTVHWVKGTEYLSFNNLKMIMAAVKGTESFSVLLSEVFEKMTWETDNEWNDAKADLQLVRSFSFLGASIPLLLPQKSE